MEPQPHAFLPGSRGVPGPGPQRLAPPLSSNNLAPPASTGSLSGSPSQAAMLPPQATLFDQRVVPVEVVSPDRPLGTRSANPIPYPVLEEAVRALQMNVTNLMNDRSAAGNSDARAATEAAELKAWRISYDTQLAQLQTSQAAARQLLEPHGESIRALQAQVRTLQESQNVNEAALANADRAELGIEIKDMRVALDAQAKLQEARLAVSSAELKQLKELITETVRKQDEKLITFDTKLQVFKQLIDEDSARQLQESSQRSLLGNTSEMQEQLSQQAQLIRKLQSEFVTQTKAVVDLQVESSHWSKSVDELKLLKAGSEKNHADLNLKHSALSKDLSDLRVQLTNPAGEADTKELRKLVEMKFAQQEQTNQAMKRDMSSLDETTTELRLTPSSQGQSQVSYSELDVLKQEVAEQRKLQASELQHEADDLHRHVDSVVKMEREARAEESNRIHTVLELLQKEVHSFAETARLGGAGSIPAKFECINPKLLGIQAGLDPRMIDVTQPSVPMNAASVAMNARPSVPMTFN